MFFRILTIALTVLISSVQVFSQNADEIIKKSIATRGDINSFKNLKSYKVDAKISVMGMEIPLTYYHKAPDKMRQESSAMGRTQIVGYNGKDLWQQANGQTMKIPDSLVEKSLAQTNQFESFLKGPFVDYKKKGRKIEYSGKVTEDGRKAYTLKMIDKDKNESYLYIDRNNYELFKIWASVKGPKGNTDIELKFSDYKKVGKFTIPYKITIKAGKVQQVFTIDKFKTNIKLKDSLFDMPKK